LAAHAAIVGPAGTSAGTWSFQKGANAVVAEIKGSGGKAVAIQADLSKTADTERLFSESKRAFGALDILVNDAGVYAFATLQDSTEQEFHREFSTICGRSIFGGLSICCGLASQVQFTGSSSISTRHISSS
jgi:NAD(P)-dependent dehydrogenase (short-subunit alcohol dehydrogenase family)